MKRIQREIEFQLVCLNLIKHDGVSISDFLGRNELNKIRSIREMNQSSWKEKFLSRSINSQLLRLVF